MLWFGQTVPVDDRGLAYGDGLFETIRVRGGVPLLGRRHQQRLLASARRLMIPLTGDELARCLAEAIQHYQPQQGDDWVLKLMLTRGTGGRGYQPPEAPQPRLLATAHGLPLIPSQPVRVVVSDVPLVVDPTLAGMKTLNRLPQVLASAAIPADCYEALMPDLAGNLVEGTRTNLFMLTREGWITPPAEHLAVAGVMREFFMQWLEHQGAAVREDAITRQQLTTDALGLVLVNSVVGALPVLQVGATVLPVPSLLATIATDIMAGIGEDD
ncbi:MAG: aminodeoxychorismate lyase [Marinobacter sp.]|nr:aminodeoxychorismate lyase [Marinobacter sp.]